MTIRYELTKDELLQLLTDYSCKFDKKRKYLIIDFVEKTKCSKYFSNYIEFINSINNIDSIDIFEETNRYYKPKSFRIDICYNIDNNIIEDRIERKYSGQLLRFNVKVK